MSAPTLAMSPKRKMSAGVVVATDNGADQRGDRATRKATTTASWKAEGHTKEQIKKKYAGSSSCTYPLGSPRILCKSFRHSSQKYSSGLVSSSMMPTQPPCCHTLQVSHWMNMPPTSSGSASDDSGGGWADSALMALRPRASRREGGKPGNSCCPHRHRVISSSSSSSASSSSSSRGGSSSSSRARWRVRVCGMSGLEPFSASSID